jgi:hypothetical protein
LCFAVSVRTLQKAWLPRLHDDWRLRSCLLYLLLSLPALCLATAVATVVPMQWAPGVKGVDVLVAAVLSTLVLTSLVFPPLVYHGYRKDVNWPLTGGSLVRSVARQSTPREASGAHTQHGQTAGVGFGALELSWCVAQLCVLRSPRLLSSIPLRALQESNQHAESSFETHTSTCRILVGNSEHPREKLKWTLPW